jgi:hypothetical protein
MAGRLPGAASAAAAPLPRALLLLAALALFSLTFLSLRSLRPAAAPPSLAIGGSRPSSFARPSVYHSAEAFAAGYAEMERSFKVYMYPDGDPKTFYQTPRKLTGKYASEGYFFQNIRESRFRTGDPDKAHLFFVPISPHKMRGKVHSPLYFYLHFHSIVRPCSFQLVHRIIETDCLLHASRNTFSQKKNIVYCIVWFRTLDHLFQAILLSLFLNIIFDLLL